MPRGSFDSDGFYAALNQTRATRGLTWKEVADEAGVSASTLTRMAQGKRPDVDGLASLVAWSGLSADDYIGRGSVAREGPETVAMISNYLRADRNLTPESARALESIMQTSYDQFRNREG